MNGYKEILGFSVSLKLVNDISLDLCVRVCTAMCVCIQVYPVLEQPLKVDTETLEHSIDK